MMKIIKKLIVLPIMSLLLLLGFQSFSNFSMASTSTDGFIIKASKIEGKLGVPLIVAGETASKKGVPMIELAMDDMTVEGMVITKVSHTPNGTLTTKIKANGTAKLKKMKIRITNMQFGELYIPKLGYIGMKDAKLLAYKQTADQADLPNFSFSFENGGGEQLADKNQEELQQLLIDLDKATKGEEEEDKDTDKDQDKDPEKDAEKDKATDEKKPDEETEDPAKQPEPPANENPETTPQPETPPAESDPGETTPEPEKPDKPAEPQPTPETSDTPAAPNSNP